MLAELEKIANEAANAAANVVPTGGAAPNPNSKSPVWGAAAGREGMVTAITTVIIAVTILPNPSQVIQPRSWIFLMLATLEIVK